MKKTNKSLKISEKKYVQAPEIFVDKLKGINILFENDLEKLEREGIDTGSPIVLNEAKKDTPLRIDQP